MLIITFRNKNDTYGPYIIKAGYTNEGNTVDFRRSICLENIDVECFAKTTLPLNMWFVTWKVLAQKNRFWELLN